MLGVAKCGAVGSEGSGAEFVAVVQQDASSVVMGGFVSFVIMSSWFSELLLTLGITFV